MAQRLTDLKLHEISLVGSPANKGARVMLMKSADGQDQKFPITKAEDVSTAIRHIGFAKDRKAVRDHIRKAAAALGAADLIPECWDKADSAVPAMTFLTKKYGPIGKWGEGEAVDFDGAQSHMESSDQASVLMNEVNEAVCALGSSIWSIQGDDTVADKDAAIRESLDQFGEHVKTIVPEGSGNPLVVLALSEAGYHLNAQGAIELSKGDDSMSALKAVAKSLGLAETATEAEVIAAIGKGASDTAGLKASVTKMEVITKMPGSHKAHFDKLSGDPAEAFLKMDEKAREAEVAKANPVKTDVTKALEAGDAFKTEDGTVVHKADFGSETAFRVAKGQAARIATQAEEIQKGKDNDDRRGRVEKAGKELANIGKADDLGDLLHRVAKHSPALADEVAVVLKAADEAVKKGGLFNEIGNSARRTGSASTAIQKKAEEFKTTNKCSIEKARVEVRKANPDLAAQEAQEAKDMKDAKDKKAA